MVTPSEPLARHPEPSDTAYDAPTRGLTKANPPVAVPGGESFTTVSLRRGARPVPGLSPVPGIRSEPARLDTTANPGCALAFS
jgi:hypothetical protein